MCGSVANRTRCLQNTALSLFDCWWKIKVVYSFTADCLTPILRPHPHAWRYPTCDWGTRQLLRFICCSRVPGTLKILGLNLSSPNPMDTNPYGLMDYYSSTSVVLCIPSAYRLIVAGHCSCIRRDIMPMPCQCPLRGHPASIVSGPLVAEWVAIAIVHASRCRLHCNIIGSFVL